MTDVQILTLALAVIVPISLLLLNNSRLTDLRASLHGSIAETKETLRAEMRTLDVKADNRQAEVLAGISRLDTFLHEAIMGKLDELDRRLTALEAAKR